MTDLEENIKLMLHIFQNRFFSPARFGKIALFSCVMAIGLLGHQTSFAQSGFLSSQEIRKTVTNARIYLATPLGGEMPLSYKSNGTVTGDGTNIGLARFFAPKETGKWWVDGNQLCQQWPTWYKGRTMCFKLQKTAENSLRWHRDDGKVGTARIVR